MLRRLRYRIAARLVGFRPVEVPEGQWIVSNTSGTLVMIKATALEITMETKLDVQPVTQSFEYIPRRSTGTFHGTIGVT